jgi:hypothetical protein
MAGVGFTAEAIDFLFSTASRPALGPGSYRMGTRGSFPGVKQLVHEADRSSFNEEVKSVGIPPLPSTSPRHSAQLFKQRDNFDL